MRLSARAAAIAPSATLAVEARAKELKAAGVDVIGFGAGEPDFDTPEHIKEAAIQAIREGKTKYTVTSGVVELRRAIQEKLRRENGVEYDISEIIVSCGAKHSLFNAFQVLVNPGDEVIVPAPYWVTYPEQVALAGGVPVIVNAGYDKGFKVTPDMLEAALTPRTRGIVLNSPSNPTGAVYTRDELEAIGEFVVKHDLFVISDEIYEKLLYDGQSFTCMAAISPDVKARTVVVNGVSKTYAMTGWRIGYAAGPKEIIQAMVKLQSHVTSNASSISQAASVAAIAGPQEPVREMVRKFEARGKYMAERLRAIPGIRCPYPSGAFYVFPEISGLYGLKVGDRVITDGDSLTDILLEAAHVAVVSGSGFGAPDHVRLSFATSMEDIRRGMDRIEEVLRSAARA